MGHLVNIINDRNEKKTLLTQFLTIFDSPSLIDTKQESWYLGDFNQDSISPQHLELDQSQILDKLTSFHFKKIELNYECEPDSQLCDSVSVLKSMLTLVFLPDLDTFSKPTLIPVSIEFEFESLILEKLHSIDGKKM